MKARIIKGVLVVAFSMLLCQLLVCLVDSESDDVRSLSEPFNGQQTGVPSHRRLSFSAVLSGQFSLPFQPEYDRGMESVLLAIHYANDRQWTEAVGRIIDALPGYSRVFLMLPSTGASPIAGELELRRKISNRPIIGTILYGPQHCWVQDLGEGSDDTFLLGWNGKEIAPVLHQMGLKTVRHYLPLEGGNVQMARNRNGKRFVFIGPKERDLAFGHLSRLGVRNPLQFLQESYLQTFQADEMVTLPVGDRSLHIDQSVLFLRDGLAVVEEFPELSEDEESLVRECRQAMVSNAVGELQLHAVFGSAYTGRTRKVVWQADTGACVETTQTMELTKGAADVLAQFQSRRPDMFDLLYRDGGNSNRLLTENILTEHGFDIVRLKTSVWHHVNRQSYVNAMAYRDQRDGRPSVMLPVYHHPGGSPDAVDVRNLRGMNLINRQILESHGFNVVPVQSVVRLGGNLHCMMYQLPSRRLRLMED